MTCEQIPRWLQREMAHCTDTDHGSELSDNDESRRHNIEQSAATQPSTGERTWKSLRATQSNRAALISVSVALDQFSTAVASFVAQTKLLNVEPG